MHCWLDGCASHGRSGEDRSAITTIRVKVKPNSRVSTLERRSDGVWLARLKSPPVNGKANAELVALIAGHFGCHKADVSIRSGASGRMKLVRIDVPRDQ